MVWQLKSLDFQFHRVLKKFFLNEPGFTFPTLLLGFWAETVLFKVSFKLSIKTEKKIFFK